MVEVTLYIVTWTGRGKTLFKAFASEQTARIFIRRLRSDTDVSYINDMREVEFEYTKAGLIHALEYGAHLARQKTRSK